MRLMNFLHRRVPVDSLCLYRAALGLVIFIESLGWLIHSRELVSNWGFHVPNLAWLPVPSPFLADLLCLTLVIGSLMVMVGLFTRFAIALTWSCWSYIYAIDSINEKAAQTIVMVVLLFLFFSACGNRFSLDNHLRKRRGLPEYDGEMSIFILRMLRFEFANIYFFSGLAKMTYPEWVNGTTFARVLNSRWATPLGIWLSSLQLNLPARIGGLGTVLFELSEGFLLQIPGTRYYAIVLGVLFHTGIQATLFIGTLGSHFIIALLLLFPEPEFVADLVKKWSASLEASSLSSKKASRN